MFDLHSHILPGFDDGARNGEISLAILRTASRNGTEGIVATPHIIEGAWIPLWTDIMAGCRELQAAASSYNIDITIFPGAEVGLYPDVLNLINGPGDYCINGGKYMLVELPPSVIPIYTDEFLVTLQIHGITPILAHPERHPGIRRYSSILERWVEAGILVQMNGASLTGQFGEKVKWTAESLLKKDLVHCIGSDAHNDIYRSSNLGVERKKIRELIGLQRAEEILVENPECIINSRSLKKRKLGFLDWQDQKSIFAR
jgi:protein-tyrosine phosphatase